MVGQDDDGSGSGHNDNCIAVFFLDNLCYESQCQSMYGSYVCL
jgi:hypothetical protein